MVRRVFLFSLLAVCLMVPSQASANSLVFTFVGGTHANGLVQFTTGPGGILSNQVGTLAQNVSPAILTGINNSPCCTSVSGPDIGRVGFTTGSWVSTVGNVYTYGSGGNLTVTANNLGLLGLPNNTVLFSGVFSSNSSFVVTVPNLSFPHSHVGNLSGKVQTTFLSPTLLALLGVPFQNHGTAVALAIDVKVGTGGAIQSGSITLVPEPGTLALFGTGLVGLAGLLRRRLS
jgi:hypothetical protein